MRKIIIVGDVGVGKSTLVNAVFGNEFNTKCAEKNSRYRWASWGDLEIYHCYGRNIPDSSEVDFWSRIIEDVKPDMIWYCINEGNYTPEDIKELKDLPVPILLVISQEICGHSVEDMKKLTLNIMGEKQRIVEVFAKEEIPCNEFWIPLDGIDRLLQASIDILETNGKSIRLLEYLLFRKAIQYLFPIMKSPIKMGEKKKQISTYIDKTDIKSETIHNNLLRVSNIVGQGIPDEGQDRNIFELCEELCSLNEPTDGHLYEKYCSCFGQ